MIYKNVKWYIHMVGKYSFNMYNGAWRAALICSIDIDWSPVVDFCIGLLLYFNLVYYAIWTYIYIHIYTYIYIYIYIYNNQFILDSLASETSLVRKYHITYFHFLKCHIIHSKRTSLTLSIY